MKRQTTQHLFTCIHVCIWYAGGLLTMDPIGTVEEGQNVTVCVSVMGSGGSSSLGSPLTVDLNVTGSDKTGYQ